MKIQNITDVEKFFEVVDQCKGTVELVSPEGDRINLKSKLAQYLSMATIFSNGYIKELDLIAHEKEDIERLIKYMYQGEEGFDPDSPELENSSGLSVIYAALPVPGP